MRPSTFDPRPWYLFAGAILLAGCGWRRGALDLSETESGADDPETGNTLTSGATTATTAGSDCDVHADCGYGYDCINGMCEYQGYQDGYDPTTGGWYCDDDVDCDDFEVCIGGQCMFEGPAPASCTVDTAPIPINLDAGASVLALSFVDVDDDGAEELVVATEDALQVHEHEGGIAMVTARQPSSPTIDAMQAGHLDPKPGQDLVILVADEQHVYSADGAGGFLAPSIEPTTLADTVGMIVADLDGQAPDDRVIWGASGASLERDGPPEIFEQSPVRDATMHARGSGHDSLLLMTTQAPVLRLFDLDGAPLADFLGAADLVAAANDEQQARYVVFYHLGRWSRGRLVDTATGENLGNLAHPHQPTKLAVADLDGDQRDELVTLSPEEGVTIWVAPLTAAGGCLHDLAPPEFEPATFGGVAVGDHDGDGDDELALHFAGRSEILIYDGG
jgi:hypothetical protein